jgi:hypothetical protein
MAAEEPGKRERVEEDLMLALGELARVTAERDAYERIAGEAILLLPPGQLAELRQRLGDIDWEALGGGDHGTE